MICYNCAGEMKEVDRKEQGDSIKIIYQCEDCKATTPIEKRKEKVKS